MPFVRCTLNYISFLGDLSFAGGTQITVSLQSLLEAGFTVAPADEEEDPEWEPVAGGEAAEAAAAPAAGVIPPALLTRLGQAISDRGGLTAEQRIERAWKAGLSAADALRGARSFPDIALPVSGLPDKFHVLVRTRSNNQARVFTSIPAFERFPDSLHIENGRRTAIYHSFASLKEVEAYIAGAGLDWPIIRA